MPTPAAFPARPAGITAMVRSKACANARILSPENKIENYERAEERELLYPHKPLCEERHGFREFEHREIGQVIYQQERACEILPADEREERREKHRGKRDVDECAHRFFAL